MGAEARAVQFAKDSSLPGQSQGPGLPPSPVSQTAWIAELILIAQTHPAQEHAHLFFSGWKVSSQTPACGPVSSASSP